MNTSTIKEEASPILEHDPTIQKYSEFHKEEIQQSKKFLSRCVLFLVFCFLFIGILLMSNYTRNAVKAPGEFMGWNKTTLFAISFVFFASFSMISIYSMVYFAIHLLKMIVKFNSPECLLLPSVLDHFALQFSGLISLVALNCLVPFELYYTIDVNSYDDWPCLFALPKWNTDVTDLEYTSWIYLNITPAVFKILGIVLLRDLSIYLLNFNIHYKYYEARVEQNTDRITVLRHMTDIINAPYVGDVDVLSQRFIQVVSLNGPVTIATLQTFFTEKIAHKIYKYCNKTDPDSDLTEEEVKEFYISTLVEQKAILKSIEHHNSTVKSFKNVLNALVVPTCIYQILMMFEFINYKDSAILQNAYLLGTLIFSMNYIFSESLKSFVNSLSFIFFVRPFEVDDLIVLDKHLFKVCGINLLTTLLFDGRTYTICSNSKLSEKPISNLRLNKVWDVEYTTTFKLADFEAKHDILLLGINNYINKRSTEFRKNAQFSKITPKDDGKVEVAILIRFNSDVSEIDTLNDRKAKFFFKLQEFFKGVELLNTKQ